MTRSITAHRLLVVVSGVALLWAMGWIPAAPVLSAAGHSPPTAGFVRALPGETTSLGSSPALPSGAASSPRGVVQTGGVTGHERVEGRRVWLRHANHLVSIRSTTKPQSHPFMTTPAAIAAQRRVAMGKAPATTVSSVALKAPGQFAAHSGRARRADTTPGTNFDGADYTGWIPPDSSIAAGPHEVVTAVNGALNTFSKSGKILTSETLDQLFSGSPQSGAFDPHVVFDPTSQRFWLVAAASDMKTDSYFYLAISNDSDTQDGWTTWHLKANDQATIRGDWCDYPEIGLSSGGYVYLTCNLFPFGHSGDSPQMDQARRAKAGPTALIRMMPESEFIGSGTSCCTWFEWRRDNTLSIQPTVMVNSAPINGEYLAASDSAGGSSVTLYEIFKEANFGTSAPPSMTTWTINTGSYNPPPCASQPNGVQCLETGDARLLGAYWQSPATGGSIGTGYLYTWSDVACGSAPVQSCPFLVVINVGGPSLTEAFSLSQSPDFAMYPAVGVRPDGTMSMVYDVANPSDPTSTGLPGVEASTIPDPSVCTDCESEDSVSVQQGTGAYDRLDKNNKNRWGAYSGAWPDPDGTGVWVTGEYAKSDGTWGIWDALTQEAGDTTPPVSSASLSPPPNSFGWNDTDTTVKVSSTDDGSGVYFQTLQGTGAQPFGPTNTSGSSATQTITAEGKTKVTYGATDNWRNTNTPQSIRVKIDKTPPTLTSVGYKVLSPTSVEISAKGTDAHCGTTGSCVRELIYYYNDAANGTISGTWHLFGTTAGAGGKFTWNTAGVVPGKHVVQVYIQDFAGNASTCEKPSSNTCPRTFTIHSLTVNQTHKGSAVDGAVKLTGGLTPNPCTAASCSYVGVAHGSSVKFTETIKPGHTFRHWLVNGAVKTGKTITVRIDQNTTVKAVFK